MRLQKHYDILVVGGGLGGVCAATAASRSGASVLLVERYGFLGGMATAGLVQPFMPYTLGQKKLANPLFLELTDLCKKEGGMKEGGLVFDEELLKILLDRFVTSSSAEILFHSYLSSAHTANGRIINISITGKSGTQTVGADYFIDSTGDGDLMALAGAEFEFGRPQDGQCQPMTLCFQVANVSGADSSGSEDWDNTVYQEWTKIFQEAKEQGRISIPRDAVLVFKTIHPGVFHFNTTRILGKNGTSNLDLSDAEQEGRQQAFELFTLLKKESPRMKDAYLSKMACQIGIRETRRLKGLYTFGLEDVLEARKFPDAVARSNYCIDIHDPTGPNTRLQKVPPGDFYEIPFRSLVPANGPENLLVGSRCISATHEGHSAIRIMPTVASLGEAAGKAAASGAKNGVPNRSLRVHFDTIDDMATARFLF